MYSGRSNIESIMSTLSSGAKLNPSRIICTFYYIFVRHSLKCNKYRQEIIKQNARYKIKSQFCSTAKR